MLSVDVWAVSYFLLFFSLLLFFFKAKPHCGLRGWLLMSRPWSQEACGLLQGEGTECHHKFVQSAVNMKEHSALVCVCRFAFLWHPLLYSFQTQFLKSPFVMSQKLLIFLPDCKTTANIVAVCSAVAPLASSELGESPVALKEGYKHRAKICWRTSLLV